MKCVRDAKVVEYGNENVCCAGGVGRLQRKPKYNGEGLQVLSGTNLPG